jgi:hypothetical protein
MDWFELLTGFRETGYEDTRAKLKVEGRRLRSLVNGKSYAIGELELVPSDYPPARYRCRSQAGASLSIMEYGLKNATRYSRHNCPDVPLYRELLALTENMPLCMVATEVVMGATRRLMPMKWAPE